MPDVSLLTSETTRPAPHSVLKTKAAQTKSWDVRVSPVVGRARNPIRETLASITSNPPATSKPLINLGLGDPTHYPLHPPPAAAVTAVGQALGSGRANGYVNGVGSVEARRAVADYHLRWDGVEYGVENIVLTHGVGQALDLVFSVMLPPSTMERANILLPRPGFAQYAALLSNLGTEIRYYDCVEENDWEVDLEMIDALCDHETRAILLTNPSNPCGSNYSKKALLDLLAVAEKHKVPIIADEIYGHMTWTAPFVPLAALSTSVPILTLSGLSKRFLLPGWRFGWVALHDPLGVATNIKRGLAVWGNRFFGPSSLVQAALPELLATGSEWFDEVTAKIQMNATIMHSAINSSPGLRSTFPTGALYMLVGINIANFPKFIDDVAFATALYQEEAVFVLPGVCFNAPGYFRVVLGSPADVMDEVGRRIEAFCERHARV
ncbi:tyrosine aminotransferase [Cryptococcus sp. DSM 104549]